MTELSYNYYNLIDFFSQKQLDGRLFLCDEKECASVFSVNNQKQKKEDLTAPNMWEKYFVNFFEYRANEFEKENKINNISKMIKKMIKKCNQKENNIDVHYWAELIYNNAQKYNISEKLLIAIIAKETDGSYKKNVNGEFGAGPMQVTKDTAEDLFDSYQAKYVYKFLNPELFDEIMNSNNTDNKKCNFSSPKDLRNACSKNDELGIKVGILCFQVKYVRVVAKFKNISVIAAIRKLKDGSLVLSPKEQEKCINLALQDYNGVPSSKAKEQYATEVCDSLTSIGVDYKNLPVIPVTT